MLHNTKNSRLVHEAISAENQKALRRHRADFQALAGILERRGVDIEAVIREADDLEVALPSWAFSQGGTRFGRFPISGEPRNVLEKLDDAAVVQQLVRVTPKVSLHFPWDEDAEPAAIKRHAAALGLGMDAVNSNTFQDQPGQRHSYKFGSLSHTSAAARRQAIEHHLHCIELGRAVGSKALTVWLGDGGSFPGQQHLRTALERVIESLQPIHKALPANWRLFIEHKPFEPAFYSTVVQDWGTSLMIAQAVGPKASCLVDLGHHLPNTNIEMVVARLIAANRLGGFHFNDSKYADDDLSTGSIKPYTLFLVFNELVDSLRDPRVLRRRPRFAPAYMIDQSANLKDPIEDLVQSAIEVHRACVKALLVDRVNLLRHQEANDVLLAERALKVAYETDVSPLLAEIRLRKGGALEPIAAYRESECRANVSAARDRIHVPARCKPTAP